MTPAPSDVDDAGKHRADPAALILALADERERIAHEIDGAVIQRLLEAALRLQATMTVVDAQAAARIAQVVDDLDQIITDVRNVIFRIADASPG